MLTADLFLLQFSQHQPSTTISTPDFTTFRTETHTLTGKYWFIFNPRVDNVFIMKTQSDVLPEFLTVMTAQSLSFSSYGHCVIKIFNIFLTLSSLLIHFFCNIIDLKNATSLPRIAKRLIKHNKSFQNSATTQAERLHQRYQRLQGSICVSF